jgi:hypothetical protein
MQVQTYLIATSCKYTTYLGLLPQMSAFLISQLLFKNYNYSYMNPNIIDRNKSKTRMSYERLKFSRGIKIAMNYKWLIYSNVKTLI